MDLLSHPLRLRPGGTLATTQEGSDANNAELIASLVLTVRGERPLVPAYGMDDPSFSGGFETSDLQAGLLLFAPHIAIDDVTVTHPSDGAERVVISYE